MSACASNSVVLKAVLKVPGTISFAISFAEIGGAGASERAPGRGW